MNCDCKQCENFGGINQLFKIYDADFFTDLNLRRIWVWLLAKFKFGSCNIKDLNFVEDPTAPKLSDIVDCSEKSMVFVEKEGKTEYKLLADILLENY